MYLPWGDLVTTTKLLFDRGQAGLLGECNSSLCHMSHTYSVSLNEVWLHSASTGGVWPGDQNVGVLADCALLSKLALRTSFWPTQQVIWKFPGYFPIT